MILKKIKLKSERNWRELMFIINVMIYKNAVALSQTCIPTKWQNIPVLGL